MDPHRLRNLLHPDLLREQLEREGRPRTMLSFHRYVRLSDVEAMRSTRIWEQLGVLVFDMRNNYGSAIGHFEGTYLPKAWAWSLS